MSRSSIERRGEPTTGEPTTTIEAKAEKKGLRPLTKEEVKELSELVGPSWEDLAGRIKFEQEFKELDKEEQKRRMEKIASLQQRREAEIKKYQGEWMGNPADELIDMARDPKGYERIKKEIKEEWDKLSPEERRKEENRLWNLRLFQYPEAWKDWEGKEKTEEEK